MAILTLRIRRASMRLPLMLLLGAALAGCMSERPPLNLPNASVVTFDGVEAHGPDCASIAIPSHLRDPDLLEHPTIPFGCANYTNLAAQLARPADATSPRPYTGSDGVTAARAIERYENPPSSQAPSQGATPGTTPAPASGTTNVEQ
jgi:pilus assembly protein CpaD